MLDTGKIDIHDHYGENISNKELPTGRSLVFASVEPTYLLDHNTGLWRRLSNPSPGKI